MKEWYTNLPPVKKLTLVFVLLFVGCVLYEVLLAHLTGEAIVWEKHFSQGFYYAAIAFAVYHLCTRSKQRKDAAKAEAVAAETATAAQEKSEEA